METHASPLRWVLSAAGNFFYFTLTSGNNLPELPKKFLIFVRCIFTSVVFFSGKGWMRKERATAPSC
jgi:hypothetical protein